MPANTLTDNPQASHTLAQDQPNIEANNLYFANTLNKDHQIGPANGTRNDGIQFEGRHIQVSLNNRGSVIPIPGDGTSSVVFDNGGNLVWRNSSGIGAVIGANRASTPAVGTSGRTFLPSPLSPFTALIYVWGLVSGNATSGSFSVTGLTTIYNFSMTPVTNGTTPSGNGTYAVKSISGNTINWVLVTSSSDYNGFYWTVIGT